MGWLSCMCSPALYQPRIPRLQDHRRQHERLANSISRRRMREIVTGDWRGLRKSVIRPGFCSFARVLGCVGTAISKRGSGDLASHQVCNFFKIPTGEGQTERGKGYCIAFFRFNKTTGISEPVSASLKIFNIFVYSMSFTFLLSSPSFIPPYNYTVEGFQKQRRKIVKAMHQTKRCESSFIISSYHYIPRFALRLPLLSAFPFIHPTLLLIVL